MASVKEKVAQRLREKGLKQSDLAEYLDVSDYGLSNMLKRGTFKSDYMIKIAKFLEVDMNFFGTNYKEGSENVGARAQDNPDDLQTKVEMLKELIATKDEVIKAKEELILELREMLKVRHARK